MLLGVEDPGNPDNPPWRGVLKELSRAGYQGLELGPYGYLPTDAAVLTSALEELNLHIVAGTLYDNLSGTGDFSALEEKTRKICSLISQLPQAEKLEGQRFAPPYLVIIDEVNPRRSIHAGHSDTAPRLSVDEWDKMMERIRRIGRISREEFGVRSAVHPHAGGFLEFSDETENFLHDVSDDSAGLCLDTGHLDYSGMDPAVWLEKCAARLDYLHFKDINPHVYETVIPRHIDFFEAAAEGVMCPIGQGRIDYEGIGKVLAQINYQGWITLEQERDPRRAGTTFADICESRRYLENRGF